MNYIPGISEIYVTLAEKLPAYIRELSLAGQIPLIMLDFIKLDVGPGATAYDEADCAAEGIAAKSVLTFITDRLPYSIYHNLAFVIVAADGTQHVIGAKEPPFPKIKVKNDLSTPVSGSASTAYTVEWSDRMIDCKTNIPSF